VPLTPTVPDLPLSRRAALVTVALTPLAACTAEEKPRSGRRSQEPSEADPEVDPDVAVAAAALADHRALLDRLRATQERHRGLDRLLDPLAARHQEHVDVLAEAVPPEAAPSPPIRPASPTARPRVVPRDARRAVDRLVRAERALCTATKRHAFAARSGAFARVLGSMAAAAAQHAVVLETAPAPPAVRR
jgi:hypothetical protein